MTVTAASIIEELKLFSDPVKAEHHQSFFKTGPGEYGEGDIFIGVTVPNMRKTAKAAYSEISMNEVEKLISSPIHEHRQTALFILVGKYNAAAKSDPNLSKRNEIAAFYSAHLKFINNWDLVDSSASYIIGSWFLVTESDTLGRKTLQKLSKSNDLWEQRVSVMITHAFIKNGIFEPTLDLCEYFLSAKHDLMHKCTGWMLREIGKKDTDVLLHFLDKHAEIMPRTMLRYSIERLTPEEKEYYMKACRKNKMQK